MGDGWYNATTGAGVIGRDKSTSTLFYADIVTAGDAAQYWRGDDLAARIIETLPNEMLRQGFDLHITADEDSDAYETPEEAEAKAKEKDKAKPGKLVRDEIEKPDKGKPDADKGKDLQERVASKWEDLGLVPALWECLAYERAYGGAALMIGAQDGGGPETPLDIDKVRSIDWLTVLEPTEIQPISWYDDPEAAKFGQACMYQINPAAPGPGEQPRELKIHKIHESRLIVFPGIKVSRLFMASLNGWGDSVLTRCLRVLRDFNMSWHAASVLLQDFAQAVYKIEGLAELFVNNQDDVIRERIKMVDYMRSSVRAILIDATEEFKREQTPISGLPDLLDRMMTRLAASADMPLTLLMGQSPGGLNATGESDIRFFYDRVRSMQDRKLRPAIERLCKMIFRALGEKEPENWSIHFRPLWQPTEKEQAEARYIQAQTDEKYITAGVLSPEEVAHSRFAGEEFSFVTNVDFEMREKMEPVAESPAKTTSQVETEEKEAEAAAKEFDLKAQVATAKTKPPFGK